MTEIVSRPHAANLVRFAKNKPEVVLLSADLTASCEADDFREAYPHRFFSLGMAEQNMMSFAGGLAREGFLPVIHTFAVFVTRRPFDQVAMSIAYPNLPVRLLGFVPGIITPGGVTHQAVDDLALMRVLPNMTVLECGDATEVEQVLEEAHGVRGPVYVRMLRGAVPRLFAPADPIPFVRPRRLSAGKDLAVVSSGICTEEAMRGVERLVSAGVGVEHLHVRCLKPLAVAELADSLAGVGRGVVTMENHSIIGGLGSAVAEVMAEGGIGAKLVRLGLQDCYAHGASREYLMHAHGLDAAALVGAAERLLGERLGIEATDLPAVRAAAGPPANPEDL